VFILVLKRHCSISFLRFKQPIIISNSVFIFLDTWIASLGQSEQTATCHVSRRLSVISERWLRSSLTRGLSVKPSQRDSSGPHQLKAHLLIKSLWDSGAVHLQEAHLFSEAPQGDGMRFCWVIFWDMGEILIKKRLICWVISARWLRFSSTRGSSFDLSREDQ